MDNVGAVVVHHKSYESIAGTVRLIIAGGVLPKNLVVVDNGQQPWRHPELSALLPSGVACMFVENHGYGAAVNAGIESLTQSNSSLAYVVISTHECRPETDAIRLMVSALDADPAVAVVGPTLVSGDTEKFIWSRGGYLTPRLRLPRHFDHRSPVVEHGPAGPTDREWLDGAFLVSRLEVVTGHPIDERYFMYMEEVDHHVALRSRGWRILWVPAARVWQSSGGIPPYYLGRNMQLFQSANGSRLSRSAAAPWSIAHRAASDVLHGRGLSGVLPMLRGWVDALKYRGSAATTSTVVIVNPLGSALAHYETELTDVLTASGVVVVSKTIDEPSSSGSSRVGWIANYLRLLLDARRVRGVTAIIVTWPPLGYLDVLITRVVAGRKAHIVMHDPTPMVRAIGYDKASVTVGKYADSARLLTHSVAAQEAVLQRSEIMTTDLPHPLLQPRVRALSTSTAKTVRVLGQYKVDRDLTALAEIAAGLADRDVALEIVGRGWPAVPGWNVSGRFLTEDEFDTAIDTADVVVIPYTKFFQSGVAIRCFERGIPFVGPNATSLDGLVLPGSKLLVGESNSSTWTDAVQFALDFNAEAAPADRDVRAHSVAEWARWVAEFA